MALPRFSVYLAILSPLGVGMGLMTWLTLGLDFDTEISPGWHFAPYFVMMTCLLFGSAIMGMWPDLIWTGKLKVLSTLLIFPILGTFLAWSWVHHGPYASFRDDRIITTVLRTSATSLVWFTTLASLQFALMLVLLIGHEMGWRWVSRFEGPSWILLPNRSSDTDDPGKSGVDQKNPNNPEQNQYDEPLESVPQVTLVDPAERQHSHSDDENTEKKYCKGDMFLENHTLTPPGADHNGSYPE